jgi:hypothetical protein
MDQTFAEKVIKATIRELANQGTKLSLPGTLPSPKKTVLNDICNDPTDFKLVAWLENDGVSMRIERRKEGDITHSKSSEISLMTAGNSEGVRKEGTKRKESNK